MQMTIPIPSQYPTINFIGVCLNINCNCDFSYLRLLTLGVSKRERKGRLKLLGTDGQVDIRTSWAASPQLKLLFNPKSWKVPISSGCFCLIWRTFNHHIAFMVDDQRIRTIKLSGLNVEWNAKDSANSQYKLFSPHLYYLSNHSRPSPCRKCPFVCLRLARVGAGSSQP